MSTAIADEALSNIRTVRAFAMEEKELRYLGKEREGERGRMDYCPFLVIVYMNRSCCSLVGLIRD